MQYGPQYLLPFSGAQLQAGCAHLFGIFVCCSSEVFLAITVAPLDEMGFGRSGDLRMRERGRAYRTFKLNE